jgi:DNA-binding XRE family transcriptional regulator
MSARKAPKPSAATAAALLQASLAGLVRDERARRRWTLRELADRARVSPAMIHAIEAGEPSSMSAVARIADAFGLTVDISFKDRLNRGARPFGQQDLVHGHLGEFEAAHLRPFGLHLSLDEPYQHYQFAGRADVLAWNVDDRALLHIENGTRFPNFQETAGAFNSKRAYLGAVMAERCGIRAWRSETHAIVALWSGEVLHAIRRSSESFASICPDDVSTFGAWWSGAQPASGKWSTLVVLDPMASGKQRVFVGLADALAARPRYRDYAEAAQAIARG